MARIDSLLHDAEQRLRARSDTPRVDGEILLAHALGRSRTWLRTWPERQATECQRRAFAALLARRVAGEPVAYLTGVREFWSMNLRVNADTLIPRPETELLVAQALSSLSGVDAPRVLDLGTGCGAIALAIGSERPDSRVSAVDISAAALDTARYNGTRLGLTNVEFLEGSWFEPVAGRRFHGIVANPPYIAAQDPHLAQGDLRFEPRLALSAGDNGLAALAHIIRQAPAALQPHGCLLLEHGYDQGPAVGALLTQAGFVGITHSRDLQGHTRVSAGHLPV